MNASAGTHAPGALAGVTRPGGDEAGPSAGTGLRGPACAGYDDAAGPPLRGRADSARGWPRRSFLELGALPSAVPCARLHARQVTWEWGLAALGADIELLVSELVTNADAPRGALLYPRCSREELKGGSWA